MTPFDDLNKPLKELFSIPQECLNKDISCLNEVVNEDDYKPNVTRIISSLRNRRFNTLQDIVNATGLEIKDLRNLGIVCQTLLYSLLNRISESPSAVINYPIEPEIMERTIYRKRNNRNEEIKARLREMGLII